MCGDDAHSNSLMARTIWCGEFRVNIFVEEDMRAAAVRAVL